MSERISDERLAELVRNLKADAEYDYGEDWQTTCQDLLEISGALGELQEARILLRALERSGYTARIVSVETKSC